MKFLSKIKFLTKLDPKLLVLFGAGLVAVGTYWQNIKSSEKTDKLSLALEKSRLENQNLNKQLVDFLTGANSFCYISASLMPVESVTKMFLTLHHIGSYPLKNIEISLINTDAYYLPYTGIQEKIDPEYSGSTELHHLGYPYLKSIPLITKGEAIPLEPIKVIRRKQMHFNIRFKADNGNVWYQRIILRRVKDYPTSLPDFIITQPNNIVDPFIPAFQVYHAESIREGENKIRLETIIAEGIESPIARNEHNTSSNWARYPLLKGETTAFPLPDQIHWDGSMAIRINHEEIRVVYP